MVFLLAALSGSLMAADPFLGYISFAWENDMYFRRDYYYSNGFQLEFFHKKIEVSPFSRLLLPPGRKQTGDSYHGLQLRQEIYTPKDLSADTIAAGDHPYSSTLTLSQVKITDNAELGIRYISELRLGILGPAALGFKTQELAHQVSNPSRPPQGWDNQVQNDLILNYNFQFEKRLL